MQLPRSVSEQMKERDKLRAGWLQNILRQLSTWTGVKHAPECRGSFEKPGACTCNFLQVLDCALQDINAKATKDVTESQLTPEQAEEQKTKREWAAIEGMVR